MAEAQHDRQQAAQLPEGDVVALLLEQHAQIRELFQQVKDAPDGSRSEVFDRLRALLAVHETSEELVLRPVADQDQWQAVADARNAEEKEANQVLSDLEDLDPATESFMAKLEAFEKAVDQHAEAEETEEFPHVLTACDEEQRQKMGRRLLSVQSMAPTHPHPAAAGSPAGQALTGPFVAMVDRVRDALSRG
jgi:hemerythrin-like domain-containing protein